MRTFVIGLVAATMALARPVLAAEPEGQGYGVGMNSCATFANLYKAQPELTENIYYAWAEGFMSGMNFEATTLYQPARNLAGINMESAKIEIRAYCDAHPLLPYYGAVIALYLERPALPKNSN